MASKRSSTSLAHGLVPALEGSSSKHSISTAAKGLLCVTSSAIDDVTKSLRLLYLTQGSGMPPNKNPKVHEG